MHVDVWVVPLGAPLAWLRLLFSVLDDAELARREKMRQTADRRRFVVCRGVLKTLLAERLETGAAQVKLTEGEHGKPYIEGHPIHFNVSHSGNLGLIALCKDAPVGVDVERMDPHDDLDDVAAQQFSEAEQKARKALGEDLQLDSFYAIWSRKEAFIKTVGLGLSFPLKQFDVAADPRTPGALEAVRHDGYDAQAFTLRGLDVAEGYSAAVAVESKDATFDVKTWTFASPSR